MVKVYSPIVISGVSLLVAGASYYHIKNEDSKKHSRHFTEQVKKHLKGTFQISHDRVKDIPGLEFVKRNVDKINELQGILKSPGGLTLLEGPSGCGKTTAIQNSLSTLKISGVYYSVRDNTSALHPLVAFAQVFGIDDMPKEMTDMTLDIIRTALEERRKSNEAVSPPVLIIDDVQQLLKPPITNLGGRQILEWCLGRAANQELTVVFVSSESIQENMKSLSGFAARLMTPHILFDYIDPTVLKPALMNIMEPERAFKDAEADKVIKVLGTHMSDIRGLQRRRAERHLAIDAALLEMLNEESREIKSVFSRWITTSVATENRELGAVLGSIVCRFVALNTSGMVTLEELKTMTIKEAEAIGLED
jgi:predicted AAA+ superfamily ATPase